jgi:hypothetical protein
VLKCNTVRTGCDVATFSAIAAQQAAEDCTSLLVVDVLDGCMQMFLLHGMCGIGDVGKQLGNICSLLLYLCLFSHSNLWQASEALAMVVVGCGAQSRLRR